MANKKSILSLSKSKSSHLSSTSMENSISQFPCSSSSERDQTFRHTPAYAQLLDEVRGQLVTPFPESGLKFPAEKDCSGEYDSELESDISREESPPKWTPLPPPNLNYIYWNTMSMLSDECFDQKENEVNVENVLPNSNLRLSPIANDIEPVCCGEADEMAVEEVDDSFNISIEDEQIFAAAALTQEHFSDKFRCMTKQEEVNQRAVVDEVTFVNERYVEEGDSPIQASDAFNMSVEEEQVFDVLEKDLDTILLQEKHRFQKSVSPSPIPKCISSNSPLLDAKKKKIVCTSPVYIYEIDDDLDDVLTEDFEIIKSSSNSSSSDDLPPVQWGRHSPTKTKHREWLPVTSSSHFEPSSVSKGFISSVAPGDCTKLERKSPNVKEDFSIQKVQQSGSAAGSSITHPPVVERCSMCYFKFPSSFTQEEADEHLALCLSLED